MEFNKLNAIISNPSWDMIALFVFLAFFFFYGIIGGKNKVVSLILSLYISGFFFENFFYLDYFINGKGIINLFILRVVIFLIILIALNFLFSRILSISSGSGRDWWQSLILSFLGTGLLFSFIFHLFPAKEIFTFSPLIKYLFASNKAFFWWLLAPLVTFFLIRK